MVSFCKPKNEKQEEGFTGALNEEIKGSFILRN